MTLDEIARELGLNEKTVRRDWASIEQTFRDAGIDIASFSAADAKVFLVVVVDHRRDGAGIGQQNVRSTSTRDQEGVHDPHAANSLSFPSSAPRVGRIPRRWSKP